VSLTRGRRTGYDNGKDRSRDWVVTVSVDHYVEVAATSAERAAAAAEKEMRTRYALASSITIKEVEQL
jgi:hypothetical protein